MRGIKNRLNEFTIMHDQFINDWNQAMTTGDTASVEIMDDNYFVVFLRGVNEKPLIYTKEEAIAGMKESVQQLRGAKKKFENRIIRLRNEESAVVFYEQVIEKDEKVLARLFTIEDWMLIDKEWKLIRETEEQL